ncbi:MAG: hypothetical protein R3195_13210 [Gemmatimonadota bacterium]|nr:hypothetical protein [Gemmatimonadota bacterium]
MSDASADREVQRRVGTALKQLSVSDSYLLRHDASERTITHRFATHLEKHFDGWDVDVEYGLDGGAVPPDVVVHRRGSRDRLLAIEIRKASDATPAEEERRRLRDRRESEEDPYRYACLIELGTRAGGKPTFEVEFV